MCRWTSNCGLSVRGFAQFGGRGHRHDPLLQAGLQNGVGGVLEGPSAYFCKHPPKQYTDDQAYELTETSFAPTRPQLAGCSASSSPPARAPTARAGREQAADPYQGRPVDRAGDRLARSAGVDHFFVVSGYRGEQLRKELDALFGPRRRAITHIVNDDWERANGTSVLKAKPYVDGPFLLTMCDHLIDPEIVGSIERGKCMVQSILGVQGLIHSILCSAASRRADCADGSSAAARPARSVPSGKPPSACCDPAASDFCCQAACSCLPHRPRPVRLRFSRPRGQESTPRWRRCLWEARSSSSSR